MIRIAIGMGTNLGDRRAHLEAAARALFELTTAGLAEPESFRLASIYETPPLGPPQPEYFNSAASIVTSLSPEAVLEATLAIEASRGRVRRERWGPRTLDLDLLAAIGADGELALDTPRLTLPHPGLASRPFALAPMLEVLPELNMRYAPILASLGGPPVVVAKPAEGRGYKGWTASAPAQ